MKIRTFTLMALCACSFASAWGQGHNELPSLPYLSMSEQSVWLLDYASIRDALALSAPESKAVDAASAAYEEEQKRLGAKASDAQVESADHAHAKAVLNALSAAHRDRLFQIMLQARGAEAFVDKTIAKRVGLTPAEDSQIHELLERADKREDDFEADLAKRILAVPRIAPKSAYEKRRADVIAAAKPQRLALEKARAADEAKAIGLLSKEQKARWKEMLGTPFPLVHYKD
jgi:hypothetical protein